ncbi:hypothetical protein MSIMFB_03235 [Mycobacterium simulans]|uniref:Uncharacterized protein n=1 Tax=Mycobacterium simulans TaxID=627089 RepID=A0A7Z7NAE5_9MYCO|nr:hypothetical protein MSIMFB_03235 [Mycobacterium simulans]
MCAIGGDQCAGLDRIAQRGPGAVGLHRVDLVVFNPGVSDGLSDDTLLCQPVGGGQPVGGAVLVDRRTRDDRQYRVMVATGVAQTLQHHHRSTLAPAGAIGGGGECLTTSIDGQPPLARELGEDERRGHDRRAAGERQAGFAAA